MTEAAGASGCLACAIVQGRTAPPGGAILETAHFHAHQDVSYYPVPGMVILASKRHFRALDEMTVDEASDFIAVAQRIRSAQRRVLAIEIVYYFYKEHTTHHFHLWMMPRLPWMAKFGASVESVRPALESAAERAGPEDVAEVSRAVVRLRRALAHQ